MIDFKQVQSVVLCYGLDDYTESLIRSECEKQSLIPSFYTEIDVFKGAIDSSTHLFGLFVQEDEKLPELEVYLKQYRKILNFLLKSKGFPYDFEIRKVITSVVSEAELTDSLIELRQYQIHPDLGGWMEKCASFLMPFQIAGETIAFKETQGEIFNHEQVYYTNLSLSPYVARIELHVDAERCSKTLFQSLGLEARLLNDFFKEMINQYSGIITRPFLNHFLEPELEVPHTTNLTDIKNEFSEIALPFSCVSDQFAMFQFKVAFLHVEGGCPFRAPMDPAWDPIQTLEFL